MIVKKRIKDERDDYEQHFLMESVDLVVRQLLDGVHDVVEAPLTGICAGRGGPQPAATRSLRQAQISRPAADSLYHLELLVSPNLFILYFSKVRDES